MYAGGDWKVGGGLAIGASRTGPLGRRSEFTSRLAHDSLESGVQIDHHRCSWLEFRSVFNSSFDL